MRNTLDRSDEDEKNRVGHREHDGFKQWRTRLKVKIDHIHILLNITFKYNSNNLSKERCSVYIQTCYRYPQN